MKDGTRPPLVTIALVAANIAAAYLLLFKPELVLDYGFNAAKPTALAAIVNIFMHQNVMHLLGNMLFLAAVGPAVEMATGRIRFAVVYFVGGLIGVVAFWFFARQTEDPSPLIGASGSVAACIAYYSTRYTRLHVTISPKFGVPILAVTVLWLLLQVLGAFVTIGGAAGGQAFWAHLGGFGSGLLLSVLFRAPKDADRQLGHIVMDRLHERSPSAKLAATEIHLAEHPKDIGALKKKAETLALLGDKEHEADVQLALLEAVPETQVPEVLTRLIGIGQIGRIPSLRRTLFAERFRASHPDLSMGLLLSVVGGDANDSQRPDALLALAGLSEASERDAWLKELAERYGLHPACELAKQRGLL